MRTFLPFPTPQAFLEKSESFLEQDEVSNNIILGVAYSLLDNPMKFGSKPFFGVVENNGSIELVALMTPPYKIVLSAPGDDIEDSCRLLIRKLSSAELTVPGVIGPLKIADCFQRNWTEINRYTAKLSMGMRAYKLTEVAPLKKPEGEFRLAEERDIPILKEWIDQFFIEVFADPKTVIKDDAAELITESDLFVWNNNGVVCMADRRRPTKHGHVIGLVYTPKIYRNKGYATACVAELCRHILNSGKSFCSLFTDLSNPTSNGIYQKIGFKPLCDFHDYSFVWK